MRRTLSGVCYYAFVAKIRTFELPKSFVLKILVVLSRFPWPLEKGDKLRAFHFLRLLSQNHEIHLFALSDRKISENDVDAIRPYAMSIEIIRCTKWRILQGLLWAFFRRKPFQVGYFYNRFAHRKIKSVVETVKPDLIFCQLVRVAEYVKRFSVSKVLDYQDALSLNMYRRSAASRGALRVICSREAKALARYESRVFDWFDSRIIISEPDKAAINHPCKDKIVVVPNGVDYEFFSPGENVDRPYHIVFTGNMSYAPNVAGALWLAGEIFPLVKAAVPDATLLLAGSSPLNVVKALANEDITVTGWMPDIRDAYNSAKVFVAPMKTGSGLQNKLLEAMSMKLPCITTSLANASLMAAENKEVIVADTAENIAGSIVKVLQDSRLSDQIGQAGYEMVRRKFSWDSIIGEFEEKQLKYIKS